MKNKVAAVNLADLEEDGIEVTFDEESIDFSEVIQTIESTSSNSSEAIIGALNTLSSAIAVKDTSSSLDLAPIISAIEALSAKIVSNQEVKKTEYLFEIVRDKHHALKSVKAIPK